MNFRKVNNITGWVICAIASLCYILTSEKAGSFWDCGEFVSAAYKVQLPHPPGAPLFILLGRLAIILSGNNPMTAAKAVNVLNALASGFTILFLFWTITHFARKLMTGFKEEPGMGQTLTIMGAGVVGALAYTFTDSFWFSAVEGEVYAFSSFFTGLIFWAMLKWEHADELAGNDNAARNRADRWIVFLFFMLGLSIGVHLLGLLTIPAVVMIYYYRRYNYTRKGAIWAFIIGCIITGIVQVAVIQWTVVLAGRFDIFFVNSFHLPFFSGFTFFFILVAVLVWLGIRWANRKNWSFLRLGLWCFAFMLIGYSSYITTMERSNANPAIDMNNVDNPMSLVYYLGRDQYGSQPILFGPHFLAQPTGYKDPKTVYTRGDNEYLPHQDPSPEPIYDSKDIQLLPRVWDPSNEQQHADFYMQWLNLPMIQARGLAMVSNITEGSIQTQDQQGKTESYELPDNYAPRVQRGQVVQPGTPMAVKIPSYGDNIRWFFTYQLGFMYWRYFMWNFSGRQNDLQGNGNVRDGNWISGISFIDNSRLADQSKLPASIQNNKAANKMYLLPFIIGIVGCVYQFFRNRKDWVVSFLLFFFTGIAIVIYLNQPGNQPRERDYAYAGSFYAYAIWIGLAVVSFVRMAREIQDKKSFVNTLIYGGVVTFLITLMSNIPSSSGGAIFSSLATAVIYGIVAAGLTYAIRAIARANTFTAGIIASVACLLVPVIMGATEWDDHDRSQKTLAPDIAKDYLNSCPPNAILFTFGDNDTYPLWYAQEVEGVRPDIRIVNTSLLGIDWYVNQLRYKVNQSEPINVVWSADQIRGLSYVTFDQGANSDQSKYYDLFDVMKNVVGKESPISTMPVRHLSVPVNVENVKKYNTVNPTDSIAPQLMIDIPNGKNYLSLDQLTMLNILAADNWSRPICFTSPYGEIGFGPYLRREGLIYRLVPVRSDGRSLDAQKTHTILTDKFRSGGANIPGVYFDEENRRHLLSIRETFAQAAISLASQGKKEEAQKLLNRSEQLISTQDMPYAMVSRFNSHDQIGALYLQAAYMAGSTDLVKKVRTALIKDLTDQKNYYTFIKNNNEEFYSSFYNDEQDADELQRRIEQMDNTFNPKTIVPENPVKKDSPAKK